MKTSLSAVARRCGALTLLPLVWSVAGAQASPSSIRWELTNPKAGWCIHFLLDPKEAENDLVRGQRTLTAGVVKDLPPAVEQILTDDPKYAEWIPSVLCTVVVDTISVEGRTFDRGDHKRPLAFLYWGVAAAGDEIGTGTGGQSLRIFATNSSSLQRVMETRLLRIDRVDIDLQPIKDSDDEQYRLSLEGATIYLDGHQRPDSSVSPTPREIPTVLTGNNKSVWKVKMSFKPAEIGTLAGALRVQGKKNLAKLLQASPIRFVGTVMAGGSGEVTFSR
jgi:hypothetical protein